MTAATLESLTRGAVVGDGAITGPLSQGFRAGLELFDQMLSATIEVGDKSGPHQEPSCWLEAEFRHGHPFKPHALPFVLRLLEHPEMVIGFAAALGNCLVFAYGDSAILGTVPTTYSALTDAQILGTTQQPQEV